MEKTIGAFEARRRFGQLIEEAFYKRDHFIVERSGRPMAVIVPIGEYNRWRRLAKDRVFELVERSWERTEGIPPEDLERDVADAIGELGRDRKSKLTGDRLTVGPSQREDT
ncbi:MAG: type II toxin-antitoxin system Phd/YefM family antitoxin [Chloroflexota bacterium]